MKLLVVYAFGSKWMCQFDSSAYKLKFVELCKVQNDLHKLGYKSDVA